MRSKKFELAFIVPTAFIAEYGNQGDFHLALSHLMDEETPNEYEKALVSSGKRLILDNGTFENGVPEEVATLFKKAVRIGASHVFAPDYLYDKTKTWDAFERMVFERNILVAENPGKKIPEIAVVCQAETVDEYLEEYEKLDQHPDVALIGISILTVPHCMKSQRIDSSRRRMLELLREIGPTKPAHLLGLGSSYLDVLEAAETCPWVVSNDTSSCFQNGMFGKFIRDKYLEVDGGKEETKVDFDQKEIPEDKRKIIDHNFETVKARFAQI